MNLDAILQGAVISTSMLGWWICVCRLNALSRNTPAGVRLQFVVLSSGFLAAALGVFLPPGIGLLLLLLSVLWFLLLSSARWRYGVPQDLLTGRRPRG